MNIYILGLGAIGSNFIIQLMKQYPQHKYYGIDMDKVEERNIGPQAFFLEQIGTPKAYAVQILLARYLRKVFYHPVYEEMEKPLERLLPGDLYIDCFDNVKSRKITITPGLDSPVFHIGFSPQFTAELIWNKDYILSGDVDPKEQDICEQVDATSFIHFVVNFAVLQISEYLQTGKKNNHIITNKYKIRQL